MRDFKQLATDLVADLKRQGADACDVIIREQTRFTTRVRLGNIEMLERSQGRGLGLRVFKNGATAVSYTTDLGDASVKGLVRESLELVKVSSPDKFNGLAPKDRIGAFDGPLPLYDDAVVKMAPDRKIDLARETEAVGRAAGPLITNSSGATWNDTILRYTLANSDGFTGEFATTNASLSVSLVAEKDGVMQTDFWYTTGRYLDRLLSAKAVGEEAARRTVRRLGARKVKSQVVPVVVSPELGPNLLGILFGAMSGGSIYRKSSFLIDKIGQQIASPLVTIVDDATLAEGPGCRPFDGEAVKASRVTFVENGVLERYACDSYSARRLGADVTGTTFRGYQSGPFVSPSNLFLRKGATSPKEIIGSVKNGLYVTRFLGSGFNDVTGDFSQGAAGYWIENGEITYPVTEITIAGNVLTMLKGISMVGSDLSFALGSTATPTFLINELTVGGA